MTKELHTGDRIRKRGFKYLGAIVKKDTAWATIEWDDGPIAKIRPLMCHVNELELADD
jgi:hypothetical protein